MARKQLLVDLDNIIEKKDTTLIPENIKKDVTILGVTGTLDGGTDTSDATALVNEILEGKTAYLGDSQKHIGTMPNNGEMNYMPNLEIQQIPEGYTSGGIVDTIENSDDYMQCLAITEDILS